MELRLMFLTLGALFLLGQFADQFGRRTPRRCKFLHGAIRELIQSASGP